MDQINRLYDDLAYLWPVLSPPEDYAPEAELVKDVVREHLGDGRHALLELGAGGGHTLHHLQTGFDCTAVDLSRPMLDLCAALNPGVTTHVGDMRSVRLGRTFDAVLIHDAIDYMLCRAEVAAALTTAAAHLRPGGVAIIAPTYTAQTFTPHDYAADQCDTDRGPVTYLSHVGEAAPCGERFDLTMVFVLPDAEGRNRVETDRHPCGLFGEPTWLELMQEAGLDPQPLQSEIPGGGRPWTLFVGVRRDA